ncbi:MAG: hypothetical protein D6814_18265 [Calditrichaeota bacterium]|nr:MAG: hypothetical protein D6814_18265 [Calditrichota bacterium]
MVAYLLTRTHGLPMWFFIMIIARDLAILLFAPVMIKKQHLIPESNWYGKLAVNGVAAALICYTLELRPWNQILLYVALLLVFLSIFSYLNRFRKAWQATQ